MVSATGREQTPTVIERDWHVLLVGGSSGTGKSAACAALLRTQGVGSAEIDDLAAAVQAMTTPEQQPLLHYWSQNADSREWIAEEILELTLQVAGSLAPALRAVVDAHLDNGPPVIMEGDYLLPALLHDEPVNRPEVRAVFLYEPDEEQLVRNLTAREPDSPPQLMRARVSWLFGQWLRTEADAQGVPALPVRPWDTLPDRILAAATAFRR